MVKTKLVFLPAWIPGHLTCLLQIATKLLQAANTSFTITVLLTKLPPEYSPSTISAIQSLASSGLDIHFQDLPPTDPPLGTDGPEDFLSLYLQSYGPHVKRVISTSPTPVAALFIDCFATTVIDVAAEFGILTYVCFTSSALMLALTLHLPILDEKIDKEFEEVEDGGVPLPRIGAVPSISMPTPLMNKKSKNYAWFVYHGRRFREAAGIVINTFEELELEPLRLMAEGLFVPDHSTPLIYPVGPVRAIQSQQPDNRESQDLQHKEQPNTITRRTLNRKEQDLTRFGQSAYVLGAINGEICI